MKYLHRIYVTAIVLVISINATAQSSKDPVDYVKPDIGGISYLLTTTNPVVLLPHDYPQVAPLVNPGITDSYLATKIYGFPAGGVSIMPSTGEIKTNPNTIASSFDRDFETRTPYYYKGLLSDYNIWASYTVGHFAIFYRFTFPEKGERLINVMMKSKGSLHLSSPNVLEGKTKIHGVPYYIYLSFSQPVHAVKTWRFDKNPGKGRQMAGKKIGMTLDFQGTNTNMIQIKAGLSYISLDQAKKNMKQAI
ncbi:MAG TPA: hypothetical protein VKA34_18395, partial [Balneolales bacterium]|nr:hypothetical protein [Balneolales bacterium]